MGSARRKKPGRGGEWKGCGERESPRFPTCPHLTVFCRLPPRQPLFLRTYPCATAAVMPCIAPGTASKAETADGQSRSQPASTEAVAMAWGRALDPSSPTPVEGDGPENAVNGKERVQAMPCGEGEVVPKSARPVKTACDERRWGRDLLRTRPIKCAHASLPRVRSPRFAARCCAHPSRTHGLEISADAANQGGQQQPFWPASLRVGLHHLH